MGDRTTTYYPCPNCGKQAEQYDAPSSLIWSNHCDYCGWDDRLNYYEDKDGVTVHRLTYEEAEAMKDKLYQEPHGPKADSPVSDLVVKSGADSTDVTNPQSGTPNIRELKEMIWKVFTEMPSTDPDRPTEGVMERFVPHLASTVEALITKTVLEAKLAKVKQSESLCGCPMCTFHSEAYAINVKGDGNEAN